MDIRRLQEPRHAEARKARQSRSSTAPKSIPTTHCGFTQHPPLPMLCLPLSNSNKQHTEGIKFWTSTTCFKSLIWCRWGWGSVSSLLDFYQAQVRSLLCQSVLSLNFVQIVGFYKVVRWNSLSYMDLSNFLYGFVKFFTWICQTCCMFFSPFVKQNEAEVWSMFWSLLISLKSSLRFKDSMPSVRCAFGNFLPPLESTLPESVFGLAEYVLQKI